MKTKIIAIVGGIIAAGLAHQASANLVSNGDFTAGSGAPGQLAFNATATGWSVPALNGSYVFDYTPGSADTTGALGQYGVVKIWGPGDGSANGLTATDPAGGNYLASDPAFQNGAITQTITGLTAGHSYALSFYWAGAQQYTFGGPTTEGWQVSLGSQTQNTPTVSLASHAFSGWMSDTMTFTATTTGSEVLSFLATGGPTSTQPPFSLLGGVSLVPGVPDASSTAALLGLAASAMGFVARFRRQSNQ
jgi:hypothetical protein